MLGAVGKRLLICKVRRDRMILWGDFVTGYIIAVFCVFFIMGLLFNFLLYSREKKQKKGEAFLTSERIIVFMIEILIGVIGFGLTLLITYSYEKMDDQIKARRMLDQAIEYTVKEIEEESAYLNMYIAGDIETRVYLNSSVTNLEYYDIVMSNDLIQQNVNMVAYGYFMDYLVRIKDTDERARSSDDKSEIGTEMRWRCQYLKKIRDLLTVCYDEMCNDLTEEEAIEKCIEINTSKLSTY